jgi:tetratricopeptide (TPR) repeat protein
VISDNYGGYMLHSVLTKFFIIVYFLLVVGCQTTSIKSTNSPVFSELYLDEIFIGNQEFLIETENDVFAIDNEMQKMVADKLLPIRDNKKRAKKLLQHIFSKDNVDLAYQSSANLTASQTYHSQKANCMSLTIMAYSLAKEAGLDVKFQDVKVPEYWIRNGQYNMLTGHVNLVLTEPKSHNKEIIYGKKILQIDFDPDLVKKSFPKRVVNKQTVLAMFYNNKGAHALVDRNYSLAYAYLKQATLVDPSYSAAWGNLGILYKLNNHIEFAIKTYEHAVSINGENLTALSNLSFLLARTNKFEKAQEIEKAILEKRIKNPYYHALLADEAYFRGENNKALKHYKKAIRMDKRVHEFYFGIAKVYYALKDIKHAEKSMKKALAYNRVKSIESQYMAKLNFLKFAEFND